MKFSNTVFFAFGSLVFANPSASESEDIGALVHDRQILVEKHLALVESQQASAPTLIDSVVDILEEVVSSVNDALPILTDTVQKIVDSVGEIPDQLVKQLSQSLNTILGDLNNGTNGLLDVAGGGVLNTLSLLGTLTNSQLNALASSIGQLNGVLAQLTQVLKVTTNLTPEVRNLIQGIVNGLNTAIPALLGPLVNFVSAVRSIALFVGLDINALGKAVTGLVNLVDTLTTSLGLGPLLGSVLNLLGKILS